VGAGYPYPSYPCDQYPNYPGCGTQTTPTQTQTQTQTQTTTVTTPTQTQTTTVPVPVPGPPPAPPKITGPSSLGTLTPSSSGTFTLPRVNATCPAGNTGSCVVDATTTASGASASSSAKRKVILVAKARFRLKPGRVSAIKMRLTPAGKRLLKRKRLIKLAGRVVVTAPTGKKATKKFTLKLRAKKRS